MRGSCEASCCAIRVRVRLIDHSLDREADRPMATSAGSSMRNHPRQKQLIFDRRYGWVFEEWTDPIEVAHLGGRGMFSLVPLTAATLDCTLHLANKAADVVVQILHNPLPSVPKLTHQYRVRAGQQVQKWRQLTQRGTGQVGLQVQKLQQVIACTQAGQKWQDTAELAQWQEFTQWGQLTQQGPAQVGRQVQKLWQLPQTASAQAGQKWQNIAETSQIQWQEFTECGRAQLDQQAQRLEHLTQQGRAQAGQRVRELRDTVGVAQLQFNHLSLLTVIQLQRLPLLHSALQYLYRPRAELNANQDSQSDPDANQ